MGVYSNNTTHLGTMEIEPNTSYFGEAGAYQAMCEGFVNDQIMFNKVICDDMMEALGESTEYIVEANVSGVIEKIKAAIKKVWAKITGLIQGFIVKLQGALCKDNKAFYKKYASKVVGKDLDKFKYKWREAGKLEMVDNSADAKASIEKVIGSSKEDLDKLKESIEEGDFLNECLGSLIKGCDDSSSFVKDAREELLGDEEELEGYSKVSSDITAVLSNNSMIKDMQKEKSKIDKTFTAMLNGVDKARTALLKTVPNGPTNGKVTIKAGDDSTNVNYTKNGQNTKDLVNRKLNVLYTVISTYQRAENMAVSAIISASKEYISQCRRVFASAVAFNPKSVKENALLVEAVGESAAFDVESLMDSYEI